MSKEKTKFKFNNISSLINICYKMQVTWVEHAEYDETQVHQLYRPLLSSGMGFGAQRWIATLQRQCECLAILMSSSVPTRTTFALVCALRRSTNGTNSMLAM